MIPNRHAMVGRSRKFGDAMRVGTFSAAAATPISYPTGVSPTDWAVIAKRGSAPAGWTDVTGTSPRNGVNLYLQQLLSADLITPATPNSAYCGAVYRDLSNLVFKIKEGRQGPTSPAVGQLAFTESVNCGGRLAVLAADLASGAPGISALTEVISMTDDSARWRICDQLDSSGFDASAGVTISWDVADGGGSGWSMYEFLRGVDG